MVDRHKAHTFLADTDVLLIFKRLTIQSPTQPFYKNLQRVALNFQNLEEALLYERRCYFNL